MTDSCFVVDVLQKVVDTCSSREQKYMTDEEFKKVLEEVENRGEK